jgi:poly(A) polymerase
MRFIDVQRMRASTLKRFIRLPRFDEHLALHRLDCLSSHRHLDAYDFVRRTLEETPAAEIRPERWLTGNDLQELGFQPGPRFSQILHALEDAQLEGLIKSKEAAIAYVDQHFGAKTGRIERSSSTSN